MVEIDDLSGAGKEFVGEIPYPWRAIAQDDDPPRAVEAAAESFGIDPRGMFAPSKSRLMKFGPSSTASKSM